MYVGTKKEKKICQGTGNMEIICDSPSVVFCGPQNTMGIEDSKLIQFKKKSGPSGKTVHNPEACISKSPGDLFIQDFFR